MKFYLNAINKVTLAIFVGILSIGIANADSSCEGYVYEKSKDKINSETVKHTLSFAEKGCDKAQREMGHFYHRGMGGLEKDEGEAKKWYTLAAEQGEKSAIAMLGLIKVMKESDEYMEKWRADRVKKQASSSQYGWSVGMTKDEAVLTRNGEPRTKNRIITSTGTREIWIYANGTVYLYFNENGLLERISENN